ncbi:uncharacterized protein OCT59_021442 [Rhizophagus irregularis]|uniref:Uncharacterized protein n=1 Tax=Rhizophagus irregularis (strain DAOM 181602 / DAOM 197198 / MUCL 43194) TaxID=747089 RepID=A0A2H5RCR0_RHIID|nr:hypothetical protein GLOIN_2v1591372 [Rhizophagus irregularis DAOM 181602=DAOM 197198]POG72861.1 hypothetical protein GLOIN_2v1591372 [Rhizophagus irregularis DAOM 181602=DAOM 197198]UZO27889.1 hypothetical protein OCT59_021442 [Rhizophagus irregularis]GBC15878.1 hypothetical protein GLOIN_2v1591372 [Rhizophagus irregularis DAOM 181602=DAOM 197198]|eukprot:XP_025179727.1 hypothetical protein GLOIN_2v1591372 [Rhizophagus irregularis DAOM 181602=DAOM 197198]
MDLDSRAYSKLIHAHNSVGGSEEYIRIIVAIGPLSGRHDHETPKMWCSRIRDLFRKILEENPRILSKNGYITKYRKLYKDDRIHGLPTNYIYCSVCDSLVYTPANGRFDDHYRDNHLKRCINGNTISSKHARRKDILQSIDSREFRIWQCKQEILREEAKINRLHLELFSQSTPHSEKDMLTSVSCDFDSRSITYKTYKQVKMTIAENTMPSAPNFEPAYIPPTRQEMVSPTSYQSSNCRSDTGKLFISSQYVKQPKGTVLRLGDRSEITVV